MTLTFEETTSNGLPLDPIPDTEDVEYPCLKCGREAGPYGGRGPKPKYCDEHKKNRPKGNAPRVKGANDALARQATEALVQLNTLFAMGTMVMGYNNTASAIAASEEGFRAQAYTALLTDPKLAAAITRAGTTSGKVALMIAYGMMGVNVVPTLALEHKEKVAERRAEDGAGT